MKTIKEANNAVVKTTKFYIEYIEKAISKYGIAELARQLNRTPQSISNIRSRQGFASLASLANEIDLWLKNKSKK